MSAKITSADVAAYLLEKIADLRGKAPGFIQIQVSTLLGSHDSSTTSVVFTAYSEHSGHCRGASIEDAIAKVAEKVRGKTEAEMLRANAAEMLGRAAKLEAAEQARKEVA